MLGHPGSQPVTAAHHVEHARRQQILHQLAEFQRRQRRERRGLQHQRVAGEQRRRHFPHRQCQRKIPRYDATDHAQGDVAHLHQAGRGVFDRVHRQVQLGELGAPMRRSLHLTARRLERLALLARQQARQSIHVRHQSRRDGVQRRLALRQRLGRPAREGFARGRDGLIELPLRGIGRRCQHLLRRGIHHGNGLRTADRMTLDRHRVGRIEIDRHARLLEMTPSTTRQRYAIPCAHSI